MQEKIINYINQLHGYTTAIKNLHWSSSTMSEHKLCDDIADSIASNEDEIAEICQGIYGQIGKNELKPIQYTISNTKSMLNDLLKDTEAFYEKIEGNEFIGLRSVIENFLGEINKFQYLIKLCLKEDMKKRISKPLHECKKTIELTESELKAMVFEACKILKEGYQTVQWQHFDNDTDRYEAYVVIDNSDQALIGTYESNGNWREAMENAIADAKDEARYNKYGSYSVYGCIGNEYTKDSLIYNTETEGMDEGTIRKIVKESINQLLITEGEKWIGSFNRDTFQQLKQTAASLNGTCSFNLNGVDFTVQATGRGYTASSGMEWKYDALKLDNALLACWQYSNTRS